MYINAKLSAASHINVSRNCTIRLCGLLSIMDQAFGELLSEHVSNRFKIELAVALNIFILTVPRRYFYCGSLLLLVLAVRIILWFSYYVSVIFCKF